MYLDALEAIAEDMNSPELLENVLKMRLASGVFDPSSSGSHTAVDKKAADLALPVGLYNIGNTCYLNSLLQYLFTVKPIRDIVLNYDDSRLDLTDASIKSRLLGGNKMQMDRGEAVVAQACEFLGSLLRTNIVSWLVDRHQQKSSCSGARRIIPES